MNRTRLACAFVAPALAAALLHAPAARAGTAVWQGGATGDLNDAANWNAGANIAAEFGLPMHFGEFGVIGYANQKSPRSALCWTRDAVEAFEKLGADWHIWNEGFGLRNPLVREYVGRLW